MTTDDRVLHLKYISFSVDLQHLVFFLYSLSILIPLSIDNPFFMCHPRHVHLLSRDFFLPVRANVLGHWDFPWAEDDHYDHCPSGLGMTVTSNFPSFTDGHNMHFSVWGKPHILYALVQAGSTLVLKISHSSTRSITRRPDIGPDEMCGTYDTVSHCVMISGCPSF